MIVARWMDQLSQMVTGPNLEGEKKDTSLTGIAEKALYPVKKKMTHQEASTQRLADFKRVFTSDVLKGEFNQFLNNIFMQLDEKKFHILIIDILNKGLSYEETYQELLKRIGEAKKGTLGTAVAQLHSLKVLKETLVGQVSNLLGQGVSVKGYCEIGYTGRLIRQMQKQAAMNLTGKKIVVNDKEKLTDYIEAGFPRPYHQFVSLNDYAPLTGSIDKSSLELVTMPIGLHHVSEDKLPTFLKSIHDVLVPGGSFLLRDHDVKNPDLDALVNVVHSVFNAATGETVDTETTELRNFTSLDHWTQILEDHGFERTASAPQIQDGDPTENALLRFVKKASNSDEALPAMETYLRMSESGYERAQGQTYLTSIEWHIVAFAKEYATFVAKKPAHEFPFFKHIAVLWDLFATSCCTAIKSDGIGAVLSSEYMLMNLFMLITTTLELAYKGTAALPLALMRRGVKNDNDLTTAQSMARTANQYADFITAIPFYDFSYFQKIKELWSDFNKRSPGHLIANTYILAVNTLFLAITGVTSAPLSWMYSGLEPGKIAMIVEDAQNIISDNAALGIKVLKEDKKNQLKAIEVPRYLKLTQLLQQFSKQNVKVASIAGQKKVQVKAKVSLQGQDPVAGLAGCNRLGNIAIPTDLNHQYVRLDVEIAQLSNVIRDLKHKGAEITYVHDF